MANKIELLTAEERSKLPMVISRRARFKNILKTSVLNYNRTSSNCLMIVGKPGLGKTFIVTETLEQMKDDDMIATYNRVPGHVTMMSCYNLIEDCATPEEGKPKVIVFDDTDVMNDENACELLKSAFDSKTNNPTNRKVYYYNKLTGREGVTFNGFGIIIANDDVFKKKWNVHQQAILDRVQLMSIDLEYGDSFIYNTHLVEKLLTDNEDGYSDKEIQSVIDMFNKDFRRWNEADAFRRSQINFSTRLVRKFVDLQRMFGSEWREYSLFYKQLNAATELAEAEKGEVEVESNVKTNVKGVLVKKGSNGTKFSKEPKMNKNGKYVDENGKEYSRSMQYYIKTKFHKVA